MIRGIDPIWQALLAGTFTWGITALGAALVFVMRQQNKKLLDGSLGFAAGVMTAASFWSLLAPAIEFAEKEYGKLAFVPVAAGFAIGAAFVGMTDRLLPKCVLGDASVIDMLAPYKTETELSLVSHDRDSSTAQRYANSDSVTGLRQRTVAARPVSEDREIGEEEVLNNQKLAVHIIDDDYKTSWRRILLLIMAVTMHNIPEGLAVGVGFASAGEAEHATFESAFNLAVGIGLQNFPEGLAVSLPLAAFGHSKLKAFWYGQLSGMVEPVAAFLGAVAVMFMKPLLPYALAFAAGAMIFVVFDDIIPEGQSNGNGKLASFCSMCGFIVMMCMDMFFTRSLRIPRKTYADLDYARHMPKEYVERMKRTVPRKVYGERFGAPDITRWYIHPDDYVPNFSRPWTAKNVGDNLERAGKYHSAQLNSKFFELRRPRNNKISDDEWTFFPGDQVQVMVGKDKGKHGIIIQVSRETNEVIVDGLHTQLEKAMEGAEKLGVDEILRWVEQPLRIDKQEVMLLDPNEDAPCTAEWTLNSAGTEYVRISKSSGYEIPLPDQASVTYEYLRAEKYIEAEGKDTPAKIALERTYVPKLCSFEEEIMENMGIQEPRIPQPTYWY